MADENIQLPPPADSLPPPVAVSPPPDGVEPTRSEERAPTSEPNPYHKTSGQLLFGGAVALAVFLACVFLLYFVFLGFFGTGVFTYFAPPILTFVVFAVLERNLVLSRLFGLQTGPDSSPLLNVISWFVPLGVGAAVREPTPAHAEAHRASTGRAPAASEPKDMVREVAETVVFVVVLVLLLKTFVAEAFVIPTGSMATTLWGYQKVVTCPECGDVFPVNCSSEVNPQNPHQRRNVTGCVCPNCRYVIGFAREHDRNPQWKIPDYHSGDRVLVAKFIYDSHIRPPHRDDVVVFKYPVSPQQNYEAMNYIKRLVGLPRETIAIYGGKLYVTNSLDYSWREPLPPGDSSSMYERLKATYENDEKAKKLFQDSMADPKLAGGFQIVRKAPDVVMAMSRLVYDNDHQAKDLAGRAEYQRWIGEGNWKSDDGKAPRRFEAAGANNWLRYRHILRDIPGKSQLITDFMGYNSGFEVPRDERFDAQPRQTVGQNWVSDLTLECDIEVLAATEGGKVTLELAKGPDRFQAEFNTANGDCTLQRRRTVGQVFEKALATQAGTKLKGPGKYHVRLANVDDRLIVWVDGDRPFGDGVAYEPARDMGPDKDNDLQPAAVGVNGSAAVSKLVIRRDTYYTVDPSSPDAPMQPSAWADPSAWTPLRERHAKTMYVQPEHYLCMGDNSPESADGRSWGLVPDRLMLGRALVVYFPFYPFGPVTRVGPIK